jgi:hypothetical protein
LTMKSNGTWATTSELESDCAAIRLDSNINITGSIHFALFINWLLVSLGSSVKNFFVFSPK